MSIKKATKDMVGAVTERLTIHLKKNNHMIYYPLNELQLKLEKYERSREDTNWLGYFEVFIAILITLLTANFKDFLGLNANIYFGAFLTCGIFCLYKSINSYFKNRKRQTIDSVIKEIRDDSDLYISGESSEVISESDNEIESFLLTTDQRINSESLLSNIKSDTDSSNDSLISPFRLDKFKI